MKILFCSLFAFALLSSCGHHNNNASNGSSSGLFGSQGQGSNGSCPNLNGRYGTQQDNMVIHTQQNGGSYNYSVGAEGNMLPFLPADGQVHQLNNGGSYQVSCGNGSVTLAIKQPGQADNNIKITDLGNNQVRVDSNGQSATGSKIDDGRAQ